MQLRIEVGGRMNKVKHKAMRVYVTERCNAKCPNCFNAKSRSNNEMTLDNFRDLCEYLKSNGFTLLKIMGGEPTIHADFAKLIKIAQSNFDSIVIFSNGTTESIKDLKLRENDSVVYNFTFNNVFSKEKMHIEVGGKRTFEVQVKKTTDEKELVQRLLELDKDNSVRISLTLDCTANIFVEKSIVLPKLKYIEQKLMEAKLDFNYDHMIPLCYLYKSGLHVSKNSCMCTTHTAGLITSDFVFKFCNQHSESLVSLKQDGNFIPWDIVENYMQKAFYEIRIKALNDYCLNCVFFNKKCNGGCWIPKDIISKDDIMNNTSFPLKSNK